MVSIFLTYARPRAVADAGQIAIRLVRYLFANKPVLLDAINKCSAADVEIPGCLRLVPVELFKCANEQLPFYCLQTDPLFRQLQR